MHAKNAENTLKYLGAARAKNQSSANPNVNNEIANGASTKVRWLDVSENYGNSIGGTNNTDITVPAGVQFIRIHCVIIYDQNLIATDNKSTLYVSKNGNPFNGLTNSGYGTWHFFNSFYGLTFYSQLIPVTPGEVFDITLSQNSGASLYLSWGSISSSVSFEFYGY